MIRRRRKGKDPPGRKPHIDSAIDGHGTYIRKHATPFNSRFPSAWDPKHVRHTAWWHYCDSQQSPLGEPFYRPSYAMLLPWECERHADQCLYMMDCYGPGGSHEHSPHAKMGYITAQAAAISWLSR
jgi:hypothetical protein